MATAPFLRKQFQDKSSSLMQVLSEIAGPNTVPDISPKLL